jgi:hypothetical protein
LLVDLADRLKAEAGLHPKGHPDSPWGEDYPAQYTSALDYLEDHRDDKERTFNRLASLIHKIQHEAAMGTPLTTGPGACEWREGFYPEAFTVACSYVRERFERERLAA